MDNDASLNPPEQPAHQAQEHRTGAPVPASARQPIATGLAKPAEAIQHCLREDADRRHEVLRAEVTAFATRFRQDFGFDLLFADAAVSALIDASLSTGKTIRALCEEKFRDFQHGLKLVNRNTGRTQFPITRDVVEQPDEVISRWVVESFRVARATEGLA